MTTTFDLLSDYADELLNTDPAGWRNDYDILDRDSFYCQQWGVEPRHIRVFVASRRSQRLRDAFVRKYKSVPAVDSFDAFAHRIVDIIDPFHGQSIGRP